MTAQAQRTIYMVLVLAGTLLGLALVHAAWSARDEMAYRTTQLERELSDKQAIAANHASIALMLNELRDMLNQLVHQLPSRFDPAAMQKSLRDQAALAGIDVASLQAGNEKTREGFYAELPTQVVVQGSSAQLLKFMEAQQHDVALHLLNALNIEPIDGKTVRATMTLAYYRYMEEP